MKRHSTFSLLIVLIIGILLTACGPTTQTAELPAGDRVQTAVAATVAAQNPDIAAAADPEPTEFEPDSELLALSTTDEGVAASEQASVVEEPTTNVVAAPTKTATNAPTEAPTSAPQPTQAAAEEDEIAQAAQTAPEIGGAGAGLYVTWVDKGNVWLWGDDETEATQVTTTGDAWEAKISPSGQFIAYIANVQNEAPELWVVDTATADAQQILDYDTLFTLPDVDTTDVFFMSISEMNWVPNSDTLTFSTALTYQFGGRPNNDLYAFDFPDGSIEPIFKAGEGGQITFAPDGKKMAISTSGDYAEEPGLISIANVDGSDLQAGLLAYKSVLTYSEYAYHAKPVWSSDSSTLWVAIPPSDPLGEEAAPTNVWQIDVATGTALPAGQFNAAPFFGGEVSIAPDIGKVAYEIEDPNEINNRILHIANIDGTEDEVVAAGQVGFQSWAPESDNFIFANMLSGDLQVGSTSGDIQAMAQQTSTDRILSLDWVNAEKFIFATGDYGDWELRLGDLAGNSFRIATPTDDYFIFDYTVLDQ